MILTNKQEEALKVAVARYRAREPWTCIGGYAGVGKSTTVRFIIQALNLAPEDVAYVTFTGKAASVLRHKGCPNAMTAHKLLYYSKRLPSGKFIFTPRPKLEYPYKLIICDEISMLPNDLWQLLLSHKIHIIALGDPFQLPPINKNTDNHVLDNPHIFLDEIMRQAKESEIIRLTMDIRESRPIQYNKGEEAMVVSPNEVVAGMYQWADQIICATNRRRKEINDYMRIAAGRGELPEAGDKVIACRNSWDITDILGENALVNGTIGYLQNVEFGEQEYPLYNFPRVPAIYADLHTDEDGIFKDLLIDKTSVMTGQKFLTPEQEYKIYRTPNLKGLEPLEMNYGYAITCHRSQGSEWNKVLVFEENFPFDRTEHARWLYTAATRASQKLVLVR